MSSMSRTDLDGAALENFREYLRIPSVQPDVNYDDCITFLKKQSKSLDLPLRVVEPCKGKPFVIITWTGTEPSEPSVFLMSHMDVVPVFEDKWTYPPFEAHMDEAGNIYARGSQDMKCVGIQYIEAIRRLKLQNVRLRRTIHVVFTPDEEIGSVLGMKEFIRTEDFHDLNVGFALDESCASRSDEFNLFFGERSSWHVWIHCPGNPGHGSNMQDNNCGEKLRRVINSFMDYRVKSMEKISSGENTLQDVVSVNLTQIKGGVLTNVVPSEMIAVFDMRLPPNVDFDKIDKLIQGWCEEAGDGVHAEFELKGPKIEPTKLDSTNPFWTAFKSASDKMGIKIRPGICPGATDSRYLRSLGVPAFGFSPMNNTKMLAHEHDETLNKDVFLRGIEIYTNIIPAVANA